MSKRVRRASGIYRTARGGGGGGRASTSEGPSSWRTLGPHLPAGADAESVEGASLAVLEGLMLEDVMARHSPTELHALSVRLQALGAQLFDGAEDRKNELEGGDAIDPRWADSMQQGFVCQARSAATSDKQWYEVKVKNVRAVATGPIRYDEVQIHYKGWKDRYDEWLPAASERLWPKGSAPPKMLDCDREPPGPHEPPEHPAGLEAMEGMGMRSRRAERMAAEEVEARERQAREAAEAAEAQRMAEMTAVDVPTLRRLVSQAAPGATIYIAEGVYELGDEALKLRQPDLTLVGAVGTELQRSGKRFALVVKAKGVRIENVSTSGGGALTIENRASAQVERCDIGGQINVEKGGALELRKSRVFNSASSGVDIFGVAEIIDSTIEENGGSGISVAESGQVELLDSVVRNNRNSGIKVENGRATLRKTSVTHNDKRGILAWKANARVSVEAGCTVRENGSADCVEIANGEIEGVPRSMISLS